MNMEEVKKVLFILNPISGVNRNPEKIKRWIDLSWRDFDGDYEIRTTEERRHATEIAQTAARDSVDMVVAIGGDGTINEVGRGLVGSRVAMGIVPAGSGNGFARSFNIPLNQEKAIAALRNPTFRPIDVGQINSHYFFNVAGIGLDAVIAAHFDEFGMRGPLPYYWVGLREFFRFRPETYKISLNDNDPVEVTPLIVSIANMPQYGNGAVIAPGALPDDGRLDVCTLSPMSAILTAWNLRRLFNGTIDRVKAMKIERAEKVSILREKEGYIHTDGDPHLEEAALKISVLPKALKIALGAAN